MTMMTIIMTTTMMMMMTKQFACRRHNLLHLYRSQNDTTLHCLLQHKHSLDLNLDAIFGGDNHRRHYRCNSSSSTQTNPYVANHETNATSVALLTTIYKHYHPQWNDAPVNVAPVAFGHQFIISRISHAPLTTNTVGII